MGDRISRRRHARDCLKNSMKMISAESGALSEFFEFWFFFGILDKAAGIGDLRCVLLFERRLIRLAAFARPKASRLCLGSRVMETHIHVLGQTRRARWPTVDTGRCDRIIKFVVVLPISRNDGIPLHVILGGDYLAPWYFDCATTTEAVRRAIQHSQESLRTLAKRYGINAKTVVKWRKRCSQADLPTGPKEPKSTVLTIEDQAIIVAFRRHTLLPLDDCLYALQPAIPHLTRSSLHRCLQRHGISQLPDVEGNKPAKKKFKAYPIGFFHIDITEVRTEEGKLHLFVAIDRTSKFAFVELHEKATTMVAADFLRHLIAAVPYKIHTVLTDNGVHFTIPGGVGLTVGDVKEAIARGVLFRAHE